VRLFVAADLPAELRRRFVSIQEDLASAPLPIRWVRPDGIHLTLKFLGEVGESRLAGIAAALREAGRDIEPFFLEAAGAAAFPDRGTPRLIWIEVRGNIAAARRLASAIDSAAARIGFPAETREFRPHLTLGRVKGAGHGDWRSILERAAGRATGGFEVSEHVLYESRLGPGGAIYAPIERFALGRTPAYGKAQ
jgi:2'-5' RNA ligase